jgi:hypothetical protein
MLPHAPTAPFPTASRSGNDGMSEPGIFKGLRGAGGPLPAATKDALLAYLGRPGDPSWSRLATHDVLEGTTVADLWLRASPAASRRPPNAAELIRALRAGVRAGLTSVNMAMPQTH